MSRCRPQIRRLGITMATAMVLIASSLATAQDDVADELQPKSQQLIAAIQSGSFVAVRRVLDAGADPNEKVDGTAPLEVAIWEEKLFVARLLCERGAKVNFADEFGYTPLMTAVEMNNAKLVDLLIDRQADVNVRENTYGISVLQSACGIGNEKIVDRLLKAGADIKHVDKYQGNLLEEAAIAGHAAIVEKLRQRGLTTKWPLHVAAGVGDKKQVEKLLAEGAQFDQPNAGWHNTPLMFAVGGGHLEIAKLLTDKGANLETKNRVGASLLHWAASNLRHDIVKWLLEEKKVDPNARDEDGATPLDWSSGDVRIEKLLKKHGGKYSTDLMPKVDSTNGVPATE